MHARRMVLTCPVRTVKADVTVGRVKTVNDAETIDSSGQIAQSRDTTGPTRRSVIRRAVAALAFAVGPVTAGGCGLLDQDPEPRPQPGPIEPLITGALDLAIRYEAAITAFPALAGKLKPVAEAHRAHAEELARAIGSPLPTASSGSAGPFPTLTTPPGGGDQAATLKALSAAEQEGRHAAAIVCVELPADQAALVASVAAARATHAEVLR